MSADSVRLVSVDRRLNQQLAKLSSRVFHTDHRDGRGRQDRQHAMAIEHYSGDIELNTNAIKNPRAGDPPR